MKEMRSFRMLWASLQAWLFSFLFFLSDVGSSWKVQVTGLS